MRLHVSIAAADYSSYGYGEYAPVAHALPDECAVEITDDAYTDSPVMWCSMLVHELGHLAGFGHNDDPTSIMFNGTLVPWQPCVAATNPPTPTAAARYYVREALPAGGRGWQVTCTPLFGRRPRCRATTARGRSMRFAVVVNRPTHTVVAADPV